MVSLLSIVFAVLVHLWLPSKEDLIEISKLGKYSPQHLKVSKLTTYFMIIFIIFIDSFIRLKNPCSGHQYRNLLHGLKLNNPGDNYV